MSDRALRCILAALMSLTTTLAMLHASSATNNADTYAPVSPDGPLLPACASDGPDGGPACYWDASERGNGLGNDFVYIP